MKRIREESSDVTITTSNDTLDSYMDLVPDIRQVIARILFDEEDHISVLSLSLINKQSHNELIAFRLDLTTIEISIGMFGNLNIAIWWMDYYKVNAPICILNMFKGYILKDNINFSNILDQKKSHIYLTIGADCYYYDESIFCSLLAMSPYINIINQYSTLFSARTFVTFYENVCKYDNLTFITNTMNNLQLYAEECNDNMASDELINPITYSHYFSQCFINNDVAAINYALRLAIRYNSVCIIKYMIFDSIYSDYYKNQLLSGCKDLLCEIANNKSNFAMIISILTPVNINPVLIINELFEHYNIAGLNHCLNIYDTNIIITLFTKNRLLSLAHHSSNCYSYCARQYSLFSALFFNLAKYDLFDGIYNKVITQLLVWNFDTVVILLETWVQKRIDWSGGNLLLLIEDLKYYGSIQLLINWMYVNDKSTLFRYFTEPFIVGYINKYMLHDECISCNIYDKSYPHDKYCALLWIKETLLPIMSELNIKKDNCEYLKRWLRKQFFYSVYKLKTALDLVEVCLE